MHLKGRKCGSKGAHEEEERKALRKMKNTCGKSGSVETGGEGCSGHRDGVRGHGGRGRHVGELSQSYVCMSVPRGNLSHWKLSENQIFKKLTVVK